MIVQKILETGEYYTYSDADFKIKQNETGIIYNTAIDVDQRFTYIETDIPIEGAGDDVSSEEIAEALEGLL